ncbi:MAG TPA: hypothetical protein VL093_13975 [Flavipsychrobacter sp.]|nr:hypothetical protein [Flavipsychrobacter sp.]
MSFLKSTLKTHMAEAALQQMLGRRLWLLTFLFSLSSRRNMLIDRRIKKISEQGPSPDWSGLNAEEKINLIYRNMAEAKAIERLMRMKN